MLLSTESHFTNKIYFKLPEYDVYNTKYPNESVQPTMILNVTQIFVIT